VCLIHDQREFKCSKNFGMEIHSKRNKMDEDDIENIEKIDSLLKEMTDSITIIKPYKYGDLSIDNFNSKIKLVGDIYKL